jgi:hypothetical protein
MLLVELLKRRTVTATDTPGKLQVSALDVSSWLRRGHP